MATPVGAVGVFEATGSGSFSTPVRGKRRRRVASEGSPESEVGSGMVEAWRDKAEKAVEEIRRYVEGNFSAEKHGGFFSARLGRIRESIDMVAGECWRRGGVARSVSVLGAKIDELVAARGAVEGGVSLEVVREENEKMMARVRRDAEEHLQRMEAIDEERQREYEREASERRAKDRRVDGFMEAMKQNIEYLNGRVNALRESGAAEGERMEKKLESLAAGGLDVKGRVEEVVREVVKSGCERMVDEVRAGREIEKMVVDGGRGIGRRWSEGGGQLGGPVSSLRRRRP